MAGGSDPLAFYWWLRRRVRELPILERIVRYAVPASCPILYFFAEEHQIPAGLWLDHGAVPPNQAVGIFWDNEGAGQQLDSDSENWVAWDDPLARQ